MLENVLHAIRSRDDFLLTSHARPDGDAMGSLLALRAILKQMGKRARIVIHDPVPRVYRSLPTVDCVIQADVVEGPYDAAILLECDGIPRTHLVGLEGHFLLNIDHHLSGRPFADVNWIDPSASSTAELIFRLAQAAGTKMTPAIATCLYAAVLTDTGSFTFLGTSENTFALARELTRAGADPARIARGIYFSHSPAKVHLLGAALATLKIEGSVAWMQVTQAQMESFGALEEDCEGLVNYALSVENVQVAIFFREIAGGRFRVSLRSKGEIDVATIAERFGGGGHTCAGGCSVAGPIAAASALVLAQLRPYMANR